MMRKLVTSRSHDSTHLETDGQAPYDGGMDTRLTKLETAVDYIQRDIKQLKDDMRAVRSDIAGIRTTDFRLLFGAIIAVALGLSGLMAKGFHWF
jgi:hypothetical protein